MHWLEPEIQLDVLQCWRFQAAYVSVYKEEKDYEFRYGEVNFIDLLRALSYLDANTSHLSYISGIESDAICILNKDINILQHLYNMFFRSLVYRLYHLSLETRNRHIILSDLLNKPQERQLN